MPAVIDAIFAKMIFLIVFIVNQPEENLQIVIVCKVIMKMINHNAKNVLLNA